MPDFNLEDHNNKVAFFERAKNFRAKISAWANENHVKVDVIGAEWPEPTSKLRLSQEGSRAWLEVESVPPGKLANSAFYGPGRGILITGNMVDELGLALITDRAGKPGWLLLQQGWQEIKLSFDDSRKGFPIDDLFGAVERFAAQTFLYKPQGAAAIAGDRK